MQAYNIEILPRPADRTSGEDHGWCFGLPPGITQAQWPLDANSGYPMMHGFTMLIPEAYRVHGPDIVALSFFACAPDHNDGGPAYVEAIADLFAEAPASPPHDADLLPFWQAIQASHPRLHRMEDILGCGHAVILLTREEFEGPLCMPPAVVDSALFEEEGIEPPAWIEHGSAHAYWQMEYSPALSLPPERHRVFRVLGEVPVPDMTFHRALRWTPRAVDPNAGIAARASDYQSPYYKDGETGQYRQREWVAGHLPNHIGGTMQPVQQAPDFSAYCIGFEEYLGGYNFGSGNAQLDFERMQIDWAC